MLRKIKVEELKLGMHLHELCGSWMSHPFFRSSFKLTDQADIRRIFAKMCAVCDVYDAVTSDRPYKKGWDPAAAVRKMAEWSNGHFESATFQAFIKTVGIYPVGTLVRLRSGRLGVVVDQSKSLLTPKVKVFFSTKSQVRLPPEVIDLSGSGHGERIAGLDTPPRWSFPNLEELWHGSAAGAW